MAPRDRRVQVPPNCDLTLGMVCLDKSEPGRTVWRMTADERFANPVGIVQGGFVVSRVYRDRNAINRATEMAKSLLKALPRR